MTTIAFASLKVTPKTIYNTLSVCYVEFTIFCLGMGRGNTNILYTDIQYTNIQYKHIYKSLHYAEKVFISLIICKMEQISLLLLRSSLRHCSLLKARTLCVYLRLSHAIDFFYSRALCQMMQLKVWPNTALGCNHR